MRKKDGRNEEGRKDSEVEEESSAGDMKDGRNIGELEDWEKDNKMDEERKEEITAITAISLKRVVEATETTADAEAEIMEQKRVRGKRHGIYCRTKSILRRIGRNFVACVRG